MRLGANDVPPTMVMLTSDVLVVRGKLVRVALTTEPCVPEVGVIATVLLPDGLE
jgi:hypothetical protein